MRDIEATKEIAAKIAAYKRRKAAAEKLQQQIDELAAEIRKYIGKAEQLLTPDGTGVLATCKERGGGSAFDAKAFQTDHPKLWEKYQTTKKSFRVLVVK